MKNILFVMPSLGSGGAEKSLVNLLNLTDYEKYAVDLLLFKREGLFLSQIPKKVRLLQPTDSLQYIPLPDLSEQPENVQRPGSEVVEKGMLT